MSVKSCDRLYKVFKAGAKARREGTSSPYKGDSLLHMFHSNGWVQEDLRIALCRSNPAYRTNQVAHDPELKAYLEKDKP